MKILIIEDNQKKKEAIAKVIYDSVDVPVTIDESSSIDTSKQRLHETMYDLVVLDIQLPQRVSESVVSDGGVQLLKEILSGRFKTPNHVVGVTAFEESLTDQMKEFEDQMLALIHYDDTSKDWESKMSAKIKMICSSDKTLKKEDTLEYDYDVALICALPEVEMQSFLNIESYNWKPHHSLSDETTTYYLGKLLTKNKEIRVVAASTSQMGMVASGILSTKLISLFKPKYLIMHGIAAGVKGEVNLGDLIVADTSWDYNSGKLSEDEEGKQVFRPDSYPLRINSGVANKFRNIKRDTGLLTSIKEKWPAFKPQFSLDIHIGDLASGSSVISTIDVIEGIQKHARKLLGVEMEAYGVYLAAEQSLLPKPIAIVAKSVCDFADSEKNDNFQNYAAYTSSRILHHLIENELDY